MDDIKQVQKEINNVYNVKRVEHNQKKQKKKSEPIWNIDPHTHNAPHSEPTLKVKKSSAKDDFDLDGGEDYGDDFF